MNGIRRTALWLVLLLTAAVAFAGETLWLGMSRQQIEELLGPSDTRASAADRTILRYGGARLELEGNRLVAVQAYPGRVELGPPSRPSAEAAARVTRTIPPAAAPAVPPESGAKPTAAPRPVEAIPAPPPAPAPATNGASAPPPTLPLVRPDNLPTYGQVAAPSPKMLVTLAGHLQRLYELRVFGATGVREPSRAFLLACGARLLLTLVLLKLVARSLECDLPWRDVAWLAAVDTIVRVALDAIAYSLWQAHVPLAACELAASGILLALVSYRPEVRHWWPALQIVAGTKVVVFVITFALFMVMLNAAA